MSDGEGFELTMELQDGYRFLVDFAQPGVPPLLLDEPEPLGEGDGPNAAKVLAAAVGLPRAPARRPPAAGQDRRPRPPPPVHRCRNEAAAPPSRHPGPSRPSSMWPSTVGCDAAGGFEDFCVVTQSVPAGSRSMQRSSRRAGHVRRLRATSVSAA